MRRKILLGSLALLVISALVIAAQEMGKMPMTKLPANVEKQLNDVRKNLNNVKAKLPEMGCCNDPACNFCPAVAGKCPCGMNVKTDVGVCGECWDGWQAGDGRIQGVDPGKVKRLMADMRTMMYQARAMHFPKGQKQQGKTAE